MERHNLQRILSQYSHLKFRNLISSKQKTIIVVGSEVLTAVPVKITVLW
jgi:SAM-dependent MidA family methyltransferase